MIRALLKNPVVFNRWCAAAALAFLAITIGARYYFSGFSRQDLSQYYMGGVIARLGAWDALYPIPTPNTTLNVGYIEGSTPKPRYIEEATKRGVRDEPRYIQPPPFALLLTPLSFLTYAQAHVAWMIILTLFTWIICLQAGRAYTLCRGETTWVAGAIVLLIACSPSAHRWIRSQNISPIVGAMVGAAALSLVERKNVRGGAAVWLGALVKYATLALVPLYIVMRRWKALLVFGAISIVTFGMALLIMGHAPFEEYRDVVAPTLTHTSTLPQNQAIMGMIARVTKTNPIATPWRIAVNVGRIAVLAALILLMVAKPPRDSARDTQAMWESAPVVLAASAALVCWMLMFSPMYWEHYTAYLAPFFGWLIWEARRSPAMLILVILTISMIWIPTPSIVKRVPEPLNAHILGSTILMLAIAIVRINRTRTNPSPSPAGGFDRC